MDRLLILADDVTGGMDTGVCFSKAGVRTKVFLPGSHLEDVEDDVAVAVFVLETRHIPPAEAYQQVYRFVKEARARHFTHYYKKTDSALRGNPGPELAGMRDALEEKTIAFFPSYPKMNRITKNGIHYIDGVPVSESVFSKDPFDPVTDSDVNRWLHHHYDSGTIDVYDGCAQEELTHQGKALLEDGVIAFAGCAGFAESLTQLLSFEREQEQREIPVRRCVVFCGSVNPVSLEQLTDAQEKGIARFHLMEEGTLSEKSGQLLKALSTADCAMVDSGAQVMAGADIRRRMEEMANTMAATAMGVVNHCTDGLLFFIGGDTLLAFLREARITQMTPHPSPFEGAVLAQVQVAQQPYWVLSKSGGFGTPNLIEQVLQWIREKTD